MSVVAVLARAFQAPAEPLAADSPIGGPVWSIVIPALLFAVAFAATFLLYRRFAKKSN
ncbi:MAG: hypothetical protein GTN62_13290 [Gemmatimonadales bacterium]|nr:hypothetical protein [Gemmatimonadales bacterium]NIN12985.1 hypothetical protein [Gemmatimonadales bacterium]NIN51062.1 hypothetical protein [Gemmatimonadales bacterium]NIP08526.1 hypothetical protein [Gemmatimonadales bacterium]NIR02244.1 hypothetical protein [Gemmatimonadales bacterium]